jgi:hypothetical protein
MARGFGFIPNLSLAILKDLDGELGELLGTKVEVDEEASGEVHEDVAETSGGVCAADLSNFA